MSEIALLGTRHQIVINEAVDLAKRFCDGAAPRIINGCLRTYIKGLGGAGTPKVLETKQQSVTRALPNYLMEVFDLERMMGQGVGLVKWMS
ncbi:NusB/RsmB/TIM44 [Dillenia turbinata]|uniref:NusB/RsmB/TIM44 n=1 Tax=Dillenia turbinata TaxID=194707 RepID=A0AAN8Z5K6_9MAGN